MSIYPSNPIPLWERFPRCGWTHMAPLHHTLHQWWNPDPGQNSSVSDLDKPKRRMTGSLVCAIHLGTQKTSLKISLPGAWTKIFVLEAANLISSGTILDTQWNSTSNFPEAYEMVPKPTNSPHHCPQVTHPPNQFPNRSVQVKMEHAQHSPSPFYHYNQSQISVSNDDYR